MNKNQIRALLSSGELRGIQVGGRGLRRIAERTAAVELKDQVGEPE